MDFIGGTPRVVSNDGRCDGDHELWFGFGQALAEVSRQCGDLDDSLRSEVAWECLTWGGMD